MNILSTLFEEHTVWNQYYNKCVLQNHIAMRFITNAYMIYFNTYYISFDGTAHTKLKGLAE